MLVPYVMYIIYKLPQALAMPPLSPRRQVITDDDSMIMMMTMMMIMMVMVMAMADGDDR